MYLLHVQQRNLFDYIIPMCLITSSLRCVAYTLNCTAFLSQMRHLLSLALLFSLKMRCLLWLALLFSLKMRCLLWLAPNFLSQMRCLLSLALLFVAAVSATPQYGYNEPEPCHPVTRYHTEYKTKIERVRFGQYIPSDLYTHVETLIY